MTIVNDRKHNRIGIGVIVAACVLLVAVTAFLLRGSERMSRVMLDELMLVLLFLLAALLFQLSRTMKKTLYSYANLELLGGAIYTFLQLVSVAGYFISCAVHPEKLTETGVFESLSRFPHTFSFFAVPVLSVVTLAVIISNLALIRHEGFRPRNLLGVLLGVLYLGGTAALYFVSGLLDNIGGHKGLVIGTAVSSASATILLLLCYFECIFFAFCLLGGEAVRKKASRDKDFILILGCAIRKNGELTPLLRERAERAVLFAEQQREETGKQTVFVPSGGQGADESVSEAEAVKRFLLEKGIPSGAILPEDRSSDTRENMLFSKKLIDAELPGAKTAFSTTNFHVFRAGIFAVQAGLDAEGVPARTKWYFWPNGFLREFFGLIAVNRRAHITVAVFTLVLTAVTYAAAYFTL